MLPIIVYIVVASIVVFLSVKLSDFVDLLDKKTNLSGAFLGGILLAAVTSLPELFTSLTATIFIHDNHYVLGNILGSNLFNMVLFAIVFIFFTRSFIVKKVNKSHLYTMFFMALLYVTTVVAAFVFDFNHILLGWFNPLSILVVVIYALSVIKTPKESSDNEEEDSSKLTVKQVVLLFILFSILLIGASIGLTYVVDWISAEFSLGSTFGGALFLGVATSLPEMTATIQLCRKKNFNAALGDILGSCVFNFIILAIADLMSFSVKDTSGQFVGIYRIDQSAFLLIVFAVIVSIVITVTLILKVKGLLKDHIATRITYIFIGVAFIGIYISFLLLSNINLNIPFAPLAI